MLQSLVPKSKENTYSEAAAQTNLTRTLATKLPTNGEKHKYSFLTLSPTPNPDQTAH